MRFSFDAQLRIPALIGRLSLRRLALPLVAVCATACCLVPASALAGTANAGLSGASAANPIADMTWGYDTGSDDEIWPTYEAATGQEKQLLAEVALRPEANWFGRWETPGKIQGTVSGYIQDVTHGSTDVLAQLSDFSLSPWEGARCGTAEAAALISSYQQWNDGFAAGIGRSRVLVVMQPDLPEAKNACLSAATEATYLREVAWATKKVNALPHATVYIDAGSSDWASVPIVTSLLVRSGIRWARGFSLNATHHASTQSEIAYGQQVSNALAKRGYEDKHFIIDTAENGSPFTDKQMKAAGMTGDVPACTSIGHPAVCQTFGIPPTWQVGLPEWNLGAHYDALADQYVDGYVWFGRPWLYGQTQQFDCQLVEQMAESTPFPYPDGTTAGSPPSAPTATPPLPANPYCPASSLG